MITDGASISELDIMAYADGEFEDDEERKIEIEAYLRRNPEHAARVLEYLRQSEEIRRVCALDMGALPSPRLMASLLRMGSRRRASKPALSGILVAVGLLLAVLAIWWPDWFPARTRSEGKFAAQAVAAFHKSSSISPTSMLASDIGSGQKPGTITFGLEPPDFADETLVRGGMRSGFWGRGEATVAYGSGKHRLVLLIAPDPASNGSKINISETKGLSVAQWRDGSLVFTLVGNLDRSEIMRLARKAKRSTEPRPYVLPGSVPTPGPRTAQAGMGSMVDLTNAEVVPTNEASPR